MDSMDNLDQPAILNGFSRPSTTTVPGPLGHIAKWIRTMQVGPTTDQIEFAKAMTIKQRGVLHALSMFDCYMSASEIADEELCELVRNGLAQRRSHGGIGGCPSWGVTTAGWIIANCIKKGGL